MKIGSIITRTIQEFIENPNIKDFEVRKVSLKRFNQIEETLSPMYRAEFQAYGYPVIEVKGKIIRGIYVKKLKTFFYYR